MPERPPPRALVAGGSGGIGLAIVKELAGSGQTVTVADLPSEAAERVALEAGADRFVPANLAIEDEARIAVEAASSEDRLHVLVNCQGISPKNAGAKKQFIEIDLAEWDEVLAVNLTSPFLLAKAAYPYLVADEGGSIVNVISITWKTGAGGPPNATYAPFAPAGAHYTASKAALANLTWSLARELAPHGVRCNGVSPGLVGSAMRGEIDTSVKERMVSQIPMHRAAYPSEVANAVAFLVSEKARYITGEILDVDGGWSAD